MPYITQARREVVSPKDGLIDADDITTAGELNYAVTVLIKTYFENFGRNYQAINDVVGALEGAKAEFQRKVVSKYEDGKEKENGEVY